MAKHTVTTTTRHTNGSTSSRHRVVHQHSSVGEPAMPSLNDVLRRGPHDRGSAPRGRVQAPQHPMLHRP